MELCMDLARVVDGCVVERIGGSDIDPDRRGVAWRVVDDVVPCLVRRVVERTRSAVGSAEPECRRVAADSAEVPLRSEEQCAVATHGDAADRDVAVLWDRLVKHHRGPLPVGAVVPVAAVSAGEEEYDRRASAETSTFAPRVVQ
jgi:hypothetical protein